MQDNGTKQSYIKIMNESLDKKIRVLDDIIEATKSQESILKAEEIDFEAFDKTIELKEKYIKEIQTLDRGFQSVYDRIKEELQENRQMYTYEIQSMKDKIRLITEKTMDIQSKESRNKESFQGKVSTVRKQAKTAKTANKVASSYYKSMTGLNVVNSQFLDTKK